MSESSTAKSAARSDTPLADALFEYIGDELDRKSEEQTLLAELADHIWTGDYLGTGAGSVAQPYASKARLEKVLSEAT